MRTPAGGQACVLGQAVSSWSALAVEAAGRSGWPVAAAATAASAPADRFLLQPPVLLCSVASLH